MSHNKKRTVRKHNRSLQPKPEPKIQAGLESIFDVRGFTKGVKEYLKALQDGQHSEAGLSKIGANAVDAVIQPAIQAAAQAFAQYARDAPKSPSLAKDQPGRKTFEKFLRKLYGKPLSWFMDLPK